MQGIDPSINLTSQILSGIQNFATQASQTQTKADIISDYNTNFNKAKNDLKQQALATGNYEAYTAKITEQLDKLFTRHSGDMVKASVARELEATIRPEEMGDATSFLVKSTNEQALLSADDSLTTAAKTLFQNPENIQTALAQADSFLPDFTAAFGSEIKAREHLQRTKDEMSQIAIRSIASASPEHGLAILDAISNHVSATKIEQLIGNIGSIQDAKERQLKDEIKHIERVERIEEVLRGEKFLDPTMQENQNAIDAWYEDYQNAPEEYLNDPSTPTILDVIKSTGLVPTDMVQNLYGQMLHGNTEQAVQSALYLHEISTFSPRVSKSVTKEILADASLVQGLKKAGLSDRTALNTWRASKQVNQEVRNLRAAAWKDLTGEGTQGTTSSTSLTDSKKLKVHTELAVDVAKEVAGGLKAPEALAGEARELLRFFFVEKGLSKKQTKVAAASVLKQTWGATSFMGEPYLMKEPLENYLNPMFMVRPKSGTTIDVTLSLNKRIGWGESNFLDFKYTDIRYNRDLEEGSKFIPGSKKDIEYEKSERLLSILMLNDSSDLFVTFGTEKADKVLKYYEYEFMDLYNNATIEDKPEFEDIVLSSIGTDARGMPSYQVIRINRKMGTLDPVVFKNKKGEWESFLWAPSTIDEFTRAYPNVDLMSANELKGISKKQKAMFEARIEEMRSATN